MEVVGAIASIIAMGQAIEKTPKIVRAIRNAVNPSKELTELADELIRMKQCHQSISETIQPLFDTNSDSEPRLQVAEPPYLSSLRVDIIALMQQLEDRFQACIQSEEATGKTRIRRRKWIMEKSEMTELCKKCQMMTKELEWAMGRFTQQTLIRYNVAIFSWTQRQGGSLAITSNDVIDPPTGETDTDEHTSGTRPSSRGSNKEICLSDRGRRDHAQPPTRAVSRCTCACHGRFASQCLGSTSSPIGAFSLSFKRVNNGSVICRDCRCWPKASQSELKFRFPLWSSRAALEATLAFGSFSGIFVSLGTINFIPVDHELWSLIYRLDVNGAAALMYRDGISILDLTMDMQVSLLQRILVNANYTPFVLSGACGFIIDMVKISRNGNAKRAAAWQCRLLLDDGFITEDNQLFCLKQLMNACDEDMESDGLPWEVYRAIADMSNLPEFMEQSRDDIINFVAPNGETYLHHACRHDNVAAARTLLLSGADMNKKSQGGLTPLHTCCVWGSVQCAELLLLCGCNFKAVDDLDQTPLHVAAVSSRQSANEVILMLLGKGASATTVTRTGWSVLHQLAISKAGLPATKQRLALLLDHGAGPLLNVADRAGITPIFSAMEYHDADALAAFVDVGACLNCVRENSWNILHHAAYYGTQAVIDILTRAAIVGLDIRTPNMEGFTPLGLLRNRYIFFTNPKTDVGTFWPDNELMAAFENLITDIRDRAIKDEIEKLEYIVCLLGQGQVTQAIKELCAMQSLKLMFKIGGEAETFRVITIQLQQDLIEPAMESIREFVEVSRARLDVSPLDEEQADPYYYMEFHGGFIVDEDDDKEWDNEE
ncbi:hypothetical protein B0I35DRAFT_446429 [Stachybotrys elegans]|uniref:NACHT-NTPase and P-loop NTPases N-terminal domain-containing protein n=1 Tax=Stachybotrys elegans TaxID=80388 RepID=A0A8K0S8X5_9HYPO|nr:hypothetical protein B0I35DRAFT_446429 [Stachybotrys elegans]